MRKFEYGPDSRYYEITSSFKYDNDIVVINKNIV